MTNLNCHKCSDEVKEGEDILHEYTLWAEEDPALIPYRMLTGRVAHRTCVIPPAENPDQLSLLDETG